MVAGAGVAGLIEPDEMRLLTVDEYLRMAAAGILDEDDRVELLDGVIVTMSPINPPHSYAVGSLADQLRFGLPRELYAVRVQDSVQLFERSAPQPDIAVVRALGEVYARRHPEPAEIVLIVEVACSTLERDRRLKLPLYAAAGIPDVWIVDLASQRVIVHRDPRGTSYAAISVHAAGESVVPLAAPELRIDPALLFVHEG